MLAPRRPSSCATGAWPWGDADSSSLTYNKIRHGQADRRGHVSSYSIEAHLPFMLSWVTCPRVPMLKPCMWRWVFTKVVTLKRGL